MKIAKGFLVRQFTRATAELRACDWTPACRYLCGCCPNRLCKGHAEQRAVDHYGRAR